MRVIAKELIETETSDGIGVRASVIRPEPIGWKIRLVDEEATEDTGEPIDDRVRAKCAL